jgi:hypothetical protein
MKVYRVYEHYHISCESGTYEYGIFSSREKALERLKEIYEKEKKEYPRNKFKFNSKKGYLYVKDRLAYFDRQVCIDEFELDEKINYFNFGYTMLF